MWSLKIVYHFWMRIFSGRVPVCAASSFFRSPTVSSSLHLTRIFFPSRSLHMTCQRDGERARKRARGNVIDAQRSMTDQLESVTMTARREARIRAAMPQMWQRRHQPHENAG